MGKKYLYIALAAAYTAPNLAPYAASYTVAGARLGGDRWTDIYSLKSFFFSFFFSLNFLLFFLFFSNILRCSRPYPWSCPALGSPLFVRFFVKLHFVCLEDQLVRNKEKRSAHFDQYSYQHHQLEFSA